MVFLIQTIDDNDDNNSNNNNKTTTTTIDSYLSSFLFWYMDYICYSSSLLMISILGWMQDLKRWLETLLTELVNTITQS